MPESVLEDVAGVPGVAEAVGDVLGYAQIVDPTTAPFVPWRAVGMEGRSGQVLVAGSYSSALPIVPHVDGAPSPPNTYSRPFTAAAP